MKYIKESKRNKYLPYKGFRQKNAENIKKIEKFKEFVPSEYIIFTYKITSNVPQMLILGRIIGAYEQHSEESWSRTASYDYLSVNVLDYVILDSKNLSTNIKFDIKSYPIRSIDKLFQSSSLKLSQEKFEEIAGDLIMQRDAEKYNL